MVGWKLVDRTRYFLQSINKGMTNPEQISPCQNCYALSHTVGTACGKCGATKPPHTAEVCKQCGQPVKIVYVGGQAQRTELHLMGCSELAKYQD